MLFSSRFIHPGGLWFSLRCLFSIRSEGVGEGAVQCGGGGGRSGAVRCGGAPRLFWDVTPIFLGKTPRNKNRWHAVLVA